MAIFAVTINLLWMSVSPSFGPYHLLLVACYATLPCFISPSIHWCIHWSVHHTLLFWRSWVFWPYCSCPNAPLTSTMAPAHPHATGVVVYLALFCVHRRYMHYCSCSNVSLTFFLLLPLPTCMRLSREHIQPCLMKRSKISVLFIVLLSKH